MLNVIPMKKAVMAETSGICVIVLIYIYMCGIFYDTMMYSETYLIWTHVLRKLGHA